MDFAVDVLGHLGQVWHQASLETRDAWVGTIWPVGLEIVDGRCRTPEESELIVPFRGKTQKMKDAGLTLETSVLFGSPDRTLFEPHFYSREALQAA